MKSKFLVFLALFLTVPLKAAMIVPSGGIPPVDPGTPPAVIALADGLHIADNGSVLTLRDVKNGVWALGSSTAIYKEYYLSLDGLLGYIPDTPNSNGFYGINGRFWAGQFLYEQIPQVKTLADTVGFTARMLQYGTLGYWGTRDFQYGLWRHGWDVGVSIKF